MKYLGHVINEEGVAVDQEKIKVMVKCPEPRKLKGLRGFLRLTGYYYRFVRDYDKAADAFNKLKDAMVRVPVLALPIFFEPFILETDASGISWELC